MRKWGRRLLITLLAAAGFYLLVVFVFMPIGARLNKPYRWKNIPFGQSRDLVHEYLGTPDSIGRRDIWFVSRGNGKYRLEVYYDALTRANGYRVFFNYNKDVFRNYYLIESSDAAEQ